MTFFGVHLAFVISGLLRINAVLPRAQTTNRLHTIHLRLGQTQTYPLILITSVVR